MWIRVEQQLVEPGYQGLLGCRECRGALTPELAHAVPPPWAHQAAPAWETVGFTLAGLAVSSAIPRLHEVVVYDVYDECAECCGYGCPDCC